MEELELGFDSIGNAAIIFYDRKPVLVTDAWISGGAYFGSWTIPYEIPKTQLDAILQSEYIWCSHGHPDHMNLESLEKLRDSTILLPDHVGGRIESDLTKLGFKVKVMEDRKWYQLSPRIRAMCIADYNQDGILLVDIDGELVVNLNDAGDRGWGGFVRKMIAKYPKSFLLALSGYGDADMIHFYDERGNLIPPAAARRFPVGESIAQKTDAYGCSYFIPSSSMHHYQREDSIWANIYTTKLEDYSNGYVSSRSKLLPAFTRYNRLTGKTSEINPKKTEAKVFKPEVFGDNWSEQLSAEEFAKLRKYFQSIEHFNKVFDFIRFRVGGKDYEIELAKKGFKRGITFEAPRGSLMYSVNEEIFDDMLIGNYMKTTLHGSWPESKLYPDFTPYIGKYADNGLAKTSEELAEYFKVYRKRAPIDYIRHRFEERTKDVLRKHMANDSNAFNFAKKLYWSFKKAF